MRVFRQFPNGVLRSSRRIGPLYGPEVGGVRYWPLRALLPGRTRKKPVGPRERKGRHA